MYSLPVLPRSDIMAIMADYQIMNLSDSDLINPTPNFVFNLYSSLLIHLDSLQDDPSQVDFTALERFENPDMHVDSVRVMNLYSKIKDFLATIECPIGFTLDDLIRPESNRTLKFLCAILNFFLHKDTKLSMLRPYGEELDALDEQRKEMEARITQLKEEIAGLNETRERERPLVLEAEAKVKELRQTIDNLNSLQSNLRKERQSMKDKAQEMSANVSKAEFELIQATEENAILRSKIVHSPDKLQRALEEKKALQVEAKDSERLAMQSFQEKTAILEVYTKAWEKMTKQLAQMHTIQEQVNYAKSAEKDVKQLKAKLADEQMLDISLEAKVVEYQAKAEQSDEHKCQLEKERNLRHEEDAKGLNDAKLEAESRGRDLEARRRKIEAVMVEVDVIKANIASAKDVSSATQQQLLRKSEEIVNELNLYSSSISQLMEVAELAS